MTSSSITIRTATPDDAAALLAIYGPLRHKDRHHL